MNPIYLIILLLTNPSAYHILQQTDTVTASNINSITALNLEYIHKICGRPDALGCTKSEFSSSGKLQYADIYVYNFQSPIQGFDFVKVLRHEIGHVYYYSHYGDGDSEQFAENYSKLDVSFPES